MPFALRNLPREGPAQALAVIAALRRRRVLACILMLSCICYILWPKISAGSSTGKGEKLDEPPESNNKDLVADLFGSNALPGFRDMSLIQTLDPSLLPGKRRPWFGRSRRRLVIVGDVHGCKDELEELLAQVSFNRGKGDHLIFTGDLISKGPKSIEAVRLAQEHHASCVRGNHEDRILLTRQELVAQELKSSRRGAPGEEYDRGKMTGGPGKRDTAAHSLARQLSDEDARWLELCPVILKVGNIKNMGDVVVVHGGLVPGVPLERQDPYSVMHMRTMDPDTHTPSSKRAGTPWSQLFDEHQRRLADEKTSKSTTVIYGHDAKEAPVIRNYTKGLDTSCVRGGMLTALIIEDGGVQSLKQVRCRGYVK